MIVALFGSPGAGKDTVAKILIEEHGYRRVAFADKVRDLTYELNPHIFSRDVCLQVVVDTYGWDITKREIDEVRRWLERVGDGCREVLGADLWIMATWHDIIQCGNVVITDLRKENEYISLRDIGAKFWFITRNDCEKRPFDEWKPEWANATIENNGTIDELREKVRKFME